MDDIFGIIIFLVIAGGLGYFIYGKLKKKWAKKAAEAKEADDDDEAYD